MLPMLNSDGQVVQGVIVEVREKEVVMDFNHPMAGKTLHFTGKVESVREASEKELKEGLHGEFLPPEEGCGGCHKGKCHSEGECHKDGCGCEGNCEDDCDCGCQGDCGDGE
jgi:FKBP-type peptidyl-prolyl cis-trans isomerase SlyD